MERLRINNTQFDEEWRDIPGYEGLYQVSNLGRVKSLPRNRKGRGVGSHLVPGKILKPIRVGEYLGFKLCNIKPSNRYCHILVAECFLNKVKGKTEVNHIDGNKHNNIVSNLEWCTRIENGIHAFNIGLHKPHTPKNRKGVLVVYSNGSKISYQSITEASDALGISASSISRACSQGRKLMCKCKVYYKSYEN